MKDEMNTGTLFTTSKVVIILNKPQHNFNYFYFNKSELRDIAIKMHL